MKVGRYALGLMLLLPIAACDDGDDMMTPAPPETLALSFSGLDPLANGFHYEGWAIVNGAAITTGKFNVDASGALVDLNGAAIANGEFATGTDLTATSAIVITIEPSGDSDAVPAATHVVAGSVSNASAALSVGAPEALGDDFANATGTYILATPTDGANTNENSGIWFLRLASGSPGVGLDLPTLPSGWAYEGWSVIDGTPVTTGRFTAVDAVDDAAPFSGTEPGPPFPGEDFLTNAPSGLTFPTDLSGTTAVISIEPEPDDSPNPFTLKPLVGMVPAGAMDHVTFDLGNNAAGFPTGSATIR